MFLILLSLYFTELATRYKTFIHKNQQIQGNSFNHGYIDNIIYH